MQKAQTQRSYLTKQFKIINLKPINTTMKKLSRVAQCAQAVRTELKEAFPKITFSVTSKSFSMGDSVDVSWSLGPSAKEVTAITDKYEYGHFDGMTDMYEISNKIEGLPQTKYLMLQRTIPQPVIDELMAGWDYQEPKEWNRHTEKIEVLLSVINKQSFPGGAHSFKVGRTDITCGLIEDFYKIEFQEPAKANVSTEPVVQSSTAEHKRKIIFAKFNSRCAETGAGILKGQEMLYDYDLKKCYSMSSNTTRQYVEQPDAALGMVEAQENAYFDSFCQNNNI